MTALGAKLRAVVERREHARRMEALAKVRAAEIETLSQTIQVLGESLIEARDLALSRYSYDRLREEALKERDEARVEARVANDRLASVMIAHKTYQEDAGRAARRQIEDLNEQIAMLREALAKAGR